MNGFSTIFAVYIPIYVYAFCVLYTIILVGLCLPKNITPSLNTFHQSNRTPLVRILFVLTLAALLGTPPTVGFFIKIMMFYVIAQSSFFLLFFATVFTLILLIFYLQAIRSASVLKKRGNGIFLNLRQGTIFMIYGQYFLTLFTVSIPYIFDIVYCFYI